jgi:hypothetical protein
MQAKETDGSRSWMCSLAGAWQCGLDLGLALHVGVGCGTYS